MARNALRIFFYIVYLPTKIISVSSYALGTLFAVYHTGRFDVLNAALMFLATLCVDMGTTAFNTYFDFTYGVDSADQGRERDKVLVYEGVSRWAAFWTSVALYAAAVVLGLILGIRVGFGIVVAGALCMAVGYFYNGGPHPISRTPVGEFFAGGFLGLILVVLSASVHVGTPDTATILAGVPSAFFIAAILTCNNTCDIAGDREAGRRTLSILLGERWGSRVLSTLVGLGSGTAVLLSITSVLPVTSGVLVLLTTPLTVSRLRAMARRGYSHSTKPQNMGAISQVFLLSTAAVVVGLAAALLGAP